MIRRAINIFKSQKQIQNFGIYGIGQFFNLVTPLLIAPYVISVCGLENYGKASIAMALMFFLIVFVDYGSDITGVKNVSLNRASPANLEKIFITNFSARFLLLVTVAGIFSAFTFSLDTFLYDRSLLLLSLGILVGQAFNPTWYLQGIESFVQITVCNIVSKLIFIVGVLSTVAEPADYIYVNLWWGIGMITANLISLLIIKIRNNFRFSSLRVDWIRQYLRENFSIFTSQVFMSAQLYSPLLLVGALGSDLLAGQYRVVEQIVVVFRTYILLSFNFVFARICFLLDNDLRKGIKTWLLFNGSNFMFIVVAMLLIFIFAPIIISYFEPAQINDLTGVLRIATLIPISMALAIPLKQLVLAFDQEKFYIQTTIATVILSTFLLLFLIPLYGLYGVISILILIEIATAVLFYAKVKKRAFIRLS